MSKTRELQVQRRFSQIRFFNHAFWERMHTTSPEHPKLRVDIISGSSIFERPNSTPVERPGAPLTALLEGHSRQSGTDTKVCRLKRVAVIHGPHNTVATSAEPSTHPVPHLGAVWRCPVFHRSDVHFLERHFLVQSRACTSGLVI